MDAKVLANLTNPSLNNEEAPLSEICSVSKGFDSGSSVISGGGARSWVAYVTRGC